jgi:hypothetical protein
VNPGTKLLFPPTAGRFVNKISQNAVNKNPGGEVKAISTCAYFYFVLKHPGTMKNPHHAVLDVIENRLELSNHKVSVPKTKLSAGSVAGKYPVLLDDGRTVVYITDQSREREIRLRYAMKR